MSSEQPAMRVDGKIFEILVERVRDYAIFVLDPEGRITTWNTGARLINGYEAGEIIGRHFSIFYPSDAVRAGWPDAELRMARMEGRFEDEGWRLRKDGSRFWSNVIITALRDENGRLLGYSKITRDITDRREREEALRESEDRFRLLAEGVMDYAIFMLDEHGTVTSWNAGAEKIKGYSREEIIGRHFSRFYLPEDIEAGKPWEELALARRQGRAEDEGWRLRKDGEKFWARVVVTALHDAEGRLRGFAKVTQDLSQRQHARELERTAARLNEFIATIAHELRNPLAPIRNAVKIMDRAAPAESVHKAMLRTIDRQSAHLKRIVDDMIDLSRVTRGTLSVVRSIVDLADIVDRAVETATPAIEQSRHTLEVEMPRGALFLNGDVDRLTQVVANILLNAARYTPPGGKIWIKGSREGGEAMVSVRDNGCGIAAEDIGSVFNMFVQAKEPLHRAGGLGIGLALARRIVALHDGSLEARSDGEGQGAEFIMRLPLAMHAPATSAPAPRRVARNREPKRILIVDDNVDAAQTLEALLQLLGHETRVVHDGPGTLEAAEAFGPDVVLLDIGLPGFSGYEVARRLRASTSRPMKIVAVTGWGQDYDRKKSLEAGFDEHLLKPVDESALLAL
jgi:PAS domain S-box-containing protein